MQILARPSVLLSAVLVASLAGAQSSLAAVRPIPPEASAIRISASESAVTISLQLQNDAAETVRLTVGRLLERTTKEVLPATIALKPNSLPMEAGRFYDVQIAVSDVFFEGDADADLLANGIKVGTLSVSRAPFAVAPTSTELVLRRRETTALDLKNDSRYPYQVRWAIQVGADWYCGPDSDCSAWPTVTIPAKDAASVPIDPPGTWFSFFGPRTKDATVWLALPGNLPKKSFKLKATLQNEPWLEAIGIALLLAAGAFVSLLVRHWVPNLQRKRELKELLRRIRHKVDAISANVDSSLRELLRSECELLDVQRKASWTLMPDYAVLASQTLLLATALEKRVDLAERIDSVYDMLPAVWQKTPPRTQNDAVEDTLAAATEALRKPQSAEAELERIRTLIETARIAGERMTAAGDSDFGTQLGERFGHLKTDLARFKDAGADSYAALKEELTGLFTFIEGAAPEITPDLYSPVDYDLSSLALCREYIWLYEGSKAGEIRTELDTLRQTLVRHLSHKSWNELRQGRLLLKQFRENIQGPELWQQIEDAESAMYITMEPSTLRVRQLIRFAARFRQQEFDWSAARDLVICEWEFPDGRTERGWTVCHYFNDLKQLYQHEATNGSGDNPGTGHNQDAAPAGKGLKVKLRFEADNGGRKRKETVKWVDFQPGKETNKSRLHSEVLALLVSIFVPLLTLLAGAREHLSQTTGWLTIFLLGFNSEAIISVFRQRSGPSN